MFFAHAENQPLTPEIAATQEQAKAAAEKRKAIKKAINVAENTLGNSPLYHFKRNVLDLVARMNQGVTHTDCETLKRQTMFIQSQLLHSLSHDPFLSPHLKVLLMEYHAKSIRATLSERRGEHLRGVPNPKKTFSR